MVSSRLFPNGSSPSTQIVKGECGLVKLLEGQSTNFAKLNRKAVFTSYPVVPCSWSEASGPVKPDINTTNSRIKHLERQEVPGRRRLVKEHDFVSLSNLNPIGSSTRN